MQLRFLGNRVPLQHLLDQVNAATGSVELVAQQLISGTRRGAETAMHARTQDRVGFAAFGGIAEFGGEFGLHQQSSEIRVETAAIENAMRVERRLQSLVQDMQRGV